MYTNKKQNLYITHDRRRNYDVTKIVWLNAFVFTSGNQNEKHKTKTDCSKRIRVYSVGQCMYYHNWTKIFTKIYQYQIQIVYLLMIVSSCFFFFFDLNIPTQQQAEKNCIFLFGKFLPNLSKQSKYWSQFCEDLFIWVEFGINWISSSLCAGTLNFIDEVKTIWSNVVLLYLFA